MVVNFHPAALEELRQARRWYEERSPVSALALAQEIDRAVLQISDAPARYPPAEYGTRRLPSRTVSLHALLSCQRVRDCCCSGGASEEAARLLGKSLTGPFRAETRSLWSLSNALQRPAKATSLYKDEPFEKESRP